VTGAATLFVTSYTATLGAGARSLRLRDKRSSTRVPINDIQAVVLFGGQMTSEAVDLCMRHGVRVTALRRSGRLRYQVSGGTTGNVLLRIEQVRCLGTDRALGVAASIVRAKIVSYRTLLRHWSWDLSGIRRNGVVSTAEALSERAARCASADSGDQLRGVEGDATRLYFGALRSVLSETDAVGVFERRTRRPPRDPVNASMSLLYGVALTELIGGIEAVGLDPQIGYLHDPRPGRMSLALDLLEEVRPDIDRLVVKLLRRRQLRIEHFERMVGGACYLSEEGRTVVLRAWEDHKEREVWHSVLRRDIPRMQLPVTQSTLLARHLRGDLPVYAPWVLT